MLRIVEEINFSRMFSIYFIQIFYDKCLFTSFIMSSLHSFLAQSSSHSGTGWAHHSSLLHHVWIGSRFVAWTAIRLIERWVLLLVTHWHLLTLHSLVCSTTLV